MRSYEFPPISIYGLESEADDFQHFYGFNFKSVLDFPNSNYKGKNIDELIEIDCGRVIWYIQNIKKFNLTPKAVTKLTNSFDTIKKFTLQQNIKLLKN